MPRKSLPRFEPIGVEESRALWVKYRGNRDVERLLLEVARAREVFSSLSAYFDVVKASWANEGLGQMVAMERMRLIFVEQHLRQGVLAGLKPPPPKDEPDEPEPALID